MAEQAAVVLALAEAVAALAWVVPEPGEAAAAVEQAVAAERGEAAVAVSPVLAVPEQGGVVLAADYWGSGYPGHYLSLGTGCLVRFPAVGFAGPGWCFVGPARYLALGFDCPAVGSLDFDYPVRYLFSETDYLVPGLADFVHFPAADFAALAVVC